jgi:transposase
MLKELRQDQKHKIIKFLRAHPRVYVIDAAACLQFPDGVRWMVRSGAHWWALSARYGNWNRLYKRHPKGPRRWCEHGVWLSLLAHCARDPDLEWVILDSSVIRAHPCAAGVSTQSCGQAAQALGYSRGFSTKMHIVVDALAGGHWAPSDFVLTPGQRHKSGQAPRLLQGLRYDYVIGDKSYD